MPDSNPFLQIPIQLFLGFGSYLLALLFWFVWPKAKAEPYKRLSWPGYILHYFHPLAWMLLGTAAFMQVRNPVLAAILAVLGGIVYAVFIMMFTRA
jgi:hypothetical protein